MEAMDEVPSQRPSTQTENPVAARYDGPPGLDSGKSCDGDVNVEDVSAAAKEYQ